MCPEKSLDPLGHHATTCKRGGDVVYRHNRLRDIVAESCRRAHLSVHLEVGHNLTPDHSNTCPADILIPHWCMGKPAALDLSVTSPLNPLTLLEAGVTAGAAAKATEERKLKANTGKCADLGWVCVPVVAESYGAWGLTARDFFSKLGSRLATSLGSQRIDTARGSSCSLCPGLALDRLGNHVTTCKRGGDVVTRHNHLRNVIVEFCHLAHLGVKVESGSGITPNLSRTWPADVLVLNWERGKHAALDITVTSPLIPSILTAASLSEEAAAEEAEVRKHRANDPKCSELSWVCIPLAVETYGNWSREAQSTFSRLASHLAIITSSHKSKVLTELYSRLNFTLVRAVARALLARCAPSLGLQDIV
ncbi:hypothetical protein EMCRGX_G015291 [Ephydatia muelleri]